MCLCMFVIPYGRQHPVWRGIVPFWRWEGSLSLKISGEVYSVDAVVAKEYSQVKTNGFNSPGIQASSSYLIRHSLLCVCIYIYCLKYRTWNFNNSDSAWVRRNKTNLRPFCYLNLWRWHVRAIKKGTLRKKNLTSIERGWKSLWRKMKLKAPYLP